MTSGSGTRSSSGPAAGQEESSSLLSALQRIAGTPRVLFYTLRGSGAPRRSGAINTRGPQEWWEFVQRRRLLDTGEFTLILALRPLSTEEALLITDWGSLFANTFLLVEPHDPLFDVTTAEGESRFLAALGGDEASAGGAQRLEGGLRRAYGHWLYWPSPPVRRQEPRRLPLDLLSSPWTVVEALEAAAMVTFPPHTFDSVLEELVEKELELFEDLGPVARAVIPFLSRLGLPIPYNARHIMQAFRRLVNAGRLWVREPGPDGTFYRGPHNPVPALLPDETFENLVR